MMKILTDSLLGLMYLHRRKLAHRDLKPENILLFGDANYPVVKICDLGCIRSVDGTVAKTEVGTLRFMAPEVLGSGKYDALLADIFSFAVVLYYITQGHMPWSNDREYNNL